MAAAPVLLPWEVRLHLPGVRKVLGLHTRQYFLADGLNIVLRPPPLRLEEGLAGELGILLEADQEANDPAVCPLCRDDGQRLPVGMVGTGAGGRGSATTIEHAQHAGGLTDLAPIETRKHSFGGRDLVRVLRHDHWNRQVSVARGIVCHGSGTPHQLTFARLSVSRRRREESVGDRQSCYCLLQSSSLITPRTSSHAA